jgi:hypothetical protein
MVTRLGNASVTVTSAGRKLESIRWSYVMRNGLSRGAASKRHVSRFLIASDTRLAVLSTPEVSATRMSVSSLLRLMRPVNVTVPERFIRSAAVGYSMSYNPTTHRPSISNRQ